MKSEFKVLIALLGISGLFAANHFGGLLWIGKQALAPLEPPKTAELQAAKIVANYIDTPECNEYKAKILEAGSGSPSSGNVQYAFTVISQEASKAGCVRRQPFAAGATALTGGGLSSNVRTWRRHCAEGTHVQSGLWFSALGGM